MAVETIRIAADAVVAEIAPSRGGMVTRLAVGGEELLYLDEATLADRSHKVRGGIPVLFPVAGRLPEGGYRVEGRSYTLPQHGFARDLEWDLVAADTRTVDVRLASSDETLESFPFPFDVRLRYRVSGNTLTIEQTYANMGARPMPLHAGFHPYFHIPDADKAKVRIHTDATLAFDHRQGREIQFHGFDLTQPEVDLQLVDHEARETRIERPGRRTLRLTWDAPLGHLVVWTQAGKDFVCVEPWTGPVGALAHGESLVHVGPRENRRAFFAITAME